jgi:hypothetical protein
MRSWFLFSLHVGFHGRLGICVLWLILIGGTACTCALVCALVVIACCRSAFARTTPLIPTAVRAPTRHNNLLALSLCCVDMCALSYASGGGASASGTQSSQDLERFVDFRAKRPRRADTASNVIVGIIYKKESDRRRGKLRTKNNW